MEKNEVRLIFYPGGETVVVPRGTLVREAAVRAGVELDSPCGGKGTCGKCRVRVKSGVTDGANSLERRALGEEGLKEGLRLACQLRAQGDLVLEVPGAQTVRRHQQILVEGSGVGVKVAPTVRKEALVLAPPDLEKQTPDWERLRQALAKLGDAGEAAPPLALLQALPTTARAEGGRVTAVFHEERLTGLEAGDTTRALYGVAVDIGTTTVVGMLLDLLEGTQLAVASRLNPQVAVGADVISRINYVGGSPQGLAELQKLILDAINEIIAELAGKAGIERETIYEVVLVGNTTMQHLFLGIPPTYLAQTPYVPAVQDAVRVPARELGLGINPAGEIYFLPLVAGFVGADTVGATLAAGMRESKGIRLLLDIGTNGELVLGDQERLVSCSTAAGPAFEGAQIRFGMRGTRGAIEAVTLAEGDLAVEVIDDVPAEGICGSGLIDAIAVLLRVGLIDETGRLLDPDEVKELPLPETLRQRVRQGEEGAEVVLVPREEAAGGTDIVLTQRDVREVQLAKGAIYAGIQVLERELGIRDEDIVEILLAGAFGNYIRKESARAIGLIPALPLERIRSLGNAAGAGAKLALLSREARSAAERLAREIEYIELSNRLDFQNEFMLAMSFPPRGELPVIDVVQAAGE